MWRDYIEPTQRFYSWVMNNHWGTNYRAYQEGFVVFRYALRPHGGYSGAEASRLALGLSQPLLVGESEEGRAEVPKLEIAPADVLALGIKPSDDGKDWIVRLFGVSGEDRKATLRWSDGRAPRIWRSDTSERAGTTVEGRTVAVRAWELVTLRVARDE